MLSAINGQAFRDFYAAVRDEATLDRKTTLLVGLAAAMTAGCGP